MNFILNSMVSAARSMNSGPIISTFVAIYNGLNRALGPSTIRNVVNVSTFRDELVVVVTTIEGERRVTMPLDSMDPAAVEFITKFFAK